MKELFKGWRKFLTEEDVVGLPDDASPNRTIPTDADIKRSNEEAKKEWERRKREEQERRALEEREAEIERRVQQAKALRRAMWNAKEVYDEKYGGATISAAPPPTEYGTIQWEVEKRLEEDAKPIFRAYERLHELESNKQGNSEEAEFLRSQIRIMEDPSGGLRALQAWETFNGIFGGVATLTRGNRGSGLEQYKNPNYNPRSATKQNTIGAYKPPAPPIINTPTPLINNFTKLTMEPLERAEKVGNVQDRYGNNNRVVKFPKGVKVYSALNAEIKNAEDVVFTPRMSRQSKNRKGKETVGLYATEFPNANRYFGSFADKLYEIEISPNAKIADLRRPGYNEAGEYNPDMSGWSAGRVSPRDQQHWLSSGITALIGNDINIGTQIVFLDPSAIISITKIKEMPKK